MAVGTLPMREGTELVGEKGFRYLLVRAFNQPNVWLAVDAATQEEIYIIKQPSADDLPGWPRFQNEMVMHELFKENPAIRKQVDRIPPTCSADPPRLVLELLQTTLWDARRKREFSTVEIKHIMRSVLLALQDIHSQNLVYADLKMQNILLSNFSPTSPSPQIIAKLADLGIVLPPARGLVQPIPYRAPEVYFLRSITPAIDIWAWGIIYCQLLEAQANFHAWGIYDDILIPGPFWEKERKVKGMLSDDFGLDGLTEYSGGGGVEGPRTTQNTKGQQWQYLAQKGVAEHELAFLKWILNPLPAHRPTATQILESRWLDANHAHATGTFRPPGTNPMRTAPRKHSDPSLFPKFHTFATNQSATPPPAPHLDTNTNPDHQSHQHNHHRDAERIFSAAPVPMSVPGPTHDVCASPDKSARPRTPRASTQGGGMYLDYGALMR